MDRAEEEVHKIAKKNEIQYARRMYYFERLLPRQVSVNEQPTTLISLKQGIHVQGSSDSMGAIFLLKSSFSER